MRTLVLMLFVPFCAPCFAHAVDPRNYTVNPALKLYAPEDERSDEERYEDEVRTNRDALRRMVTLTLFSWGGDTEDDQEEEPPKSEPLLPGKLKLQARSDQLKLVWRHDERQVELRTDGSSVQLEYRVAFSWSEWFH